MASKQVDASGEERLPEVMALYKRLSDESSSGGGGGAVTQAALLGAILGGKEQAARQELKFGRPRGWRSAAKRAEETFVQKLDLNVFIKSANDIEPFLNTYKHYREGFLTAAREAAKADQEEETAAADADATK